MITDIVSGNIDFADVMFLIAVILAVLSAIASYGGEIARHTQSLLALAVASVALGFLVL